MTTLPGLGKSTLLKLEVGRRCWPTVRRKYAAALPSLAEMKKGFALDLTAQANTTFGRPAGHAPQDNRRQDSIVGFAEIRDFCGILVRQLAVGTLIWLVLSVDDQSD